MFRGRRVISLGCGSRHSAAVTSVGDVYTWGRGFEGQTGHAPLASSCTTTGNGSDVTDSITTRTAQIQVNLYSISQAELIINCR